MFQKMEYVNCKPFNIESKDIYIYMLVLLVVVLSKFLFLDPRCSASRRKPLAYKLQGDNLLGPHARNASINYSIFYGAQNVQTPIDDVMSRIHMLHLSLGLVRWPSVLLGRQLGPGLCL